MDNKNREEIPYLKTMANLITRLRKICLTTTRPPKEEYTLVPNLILIFKV
jgi:hypothetical protein